MRVIETLSCRLKLGGVWYGRGDAVELDEEDAAIYRMRGISAPAKPGTKAKNVMKPQEVGIVTKAEEPEEPTEVKSHGKRTR